MNWKICILFLGFPAVLISEEAHSLGPPKYFHVPERLDTALILDWNSRYITEGRDNLSGEGNWGSTVKASLGSFEFAGWIGASDGARYEELNVFSAYHFEAAGLNWYASYNHLQFLSDESRDNEIGLGVETPELPGGFVAAIDWYYSTESAGSFFSATLARDFDLGQNGSLTPALIYGRNDGYISDGHNGANHLAVQLAASYEINVGITLSAYVEQSLAIHSAPGQFPGDASLSDIFYGGIAVSIAGW